MSDTTNVQPPVYETLYDSLHCCQGATECTGLRWNIKNQCAEFILYVNGISQSDVGRADDAACLAWAQAHSCPLCGHDFDRVPTEEELESLRKCQEAFEAGQKLFTKAYEEGYPKTIMTDVTVSTDDGESFEARVPVRYEHPAYVFELKKPADPS